MTPEVSVTYKLTDTVNLYGAYKTGFKSGGIDNSALPTAGLAGLGDPTIDPDTGLTLDEITQAGLIFESETSAGGEIGIKSQLYNRTLTFNLTAFRYVVDNLQVQVFDGAAVQFSTFNAGEVTTQGIEFDADWRTPVEGLGIFGSFSYLDAEFSDTFIGLDGLDLNGRDLGRAPSVAFNVGADYQHALTNDLTLGLNGNLSYSGSYFVADNFLNDLVQDSFVTLDAAISLRSASGRWELSVFGTNLTDEIFIVNGVPRPFGFITDPFGPSDDTVVNISRGRQLFVGLKYGF